MKQGAAMSQKDVWLDDDCDEDCVERCYFKNVSKDERPNEQYLSCLFEKSSSRREEALSVIVENLNFKPRFKFVEKNFATLLYQCLSIMKKGSAKELRLASKTIGLIAMITSCSDNAREAYKDSVPVVSKLLKTKSINSKTLHSLAVVAFFSAADNFDIEEAMLLMWKIINPDCSTDSSKQPTTVLAAAISSWCFLLSAIKGQQLSSKYWEGAISCFSDLLDNEDKAVCSAASVALALIFETNCLNMFTTHESVASERNNIIDKLRSQANATLDVLNFFEEGKCPKKWVSIDDYKPVTLSTWSQIIQLNFMKHFLGEAGFKNHMKENKNLHDLFDLVLESSHPSAEIPALSIPERKEEVIVHLPRYESIGAKTFGIKSEKMLAEAGKNQKQWSKFRNCRIERAKHKLREKQRHASEEMSLGCFSDDA